MFRRYFNLNFIKYITLQLQLIRKMQLDEYWFEFLVFSKFKLKYSFLFIKNQLAVSFNRLKLYFSLRKQSCFHLVSIM